MLIFENKEQKLINTLKFIGSPFKKFVSTGEIKEDIGLVPSRKDFLGRIVKIFCFTDNRGSWTREDSFILGTKKCFT